MEQNSHSDLLSIKNQINILNMASKVKVWVVWRESRKRWEVGFRWEGKLWQFYSWIIPGGSQKYAFTKENEHIAHQYAEYIRSLAVPDLKTGVCKFDPTKLSKTRKSKYALRRYGEVWLKGYDQKAASGDCTSAYVGILRGYLESYIFPALGDMSLFDIDSITIREFYNGLFDGKRSKKHIQNIVDACRALLRSAVDDVHGFDLPKFPKYRDRTKVKTHKFLLPDEQGRVLSFVEPQHRAFLMVAFYGLRPQEIINLKRSDLIWLEDGQGKYPALSVKTLKGGVPRVIPIDWTTYNEIKAINPVSFEHLVSFKGLKYSRKTAYKAMRRALDKAGLKDFNPYEATRHSRASQLNMMGASAFDIQQSLGHADIRTSQVYTHVKADMRWIRK